MRTPSGESSYDEVTSSLYIIISTNGYLITVQQRFQDNELQTGLDNYTTVLIFNPLGPKSGQHIFSPDNQKEKL